MRSILLTMILVFVVGSTIAQNSEEMERIGSVIQDYEEALNSNDVAKVLRNFSDNGVLVLQGAPTAIGEEAIKMFFKSIFEIIDFDLKFSIEEIILMSPDWALVRTTTRSNNSPDSEEGGHEIFILQKQNEGSWKIARYAGSRAS